MKTANKLGRKMSAKKGTRRTSAKTDQHEIRTKKQLADRIRGIVRQRGWTQKAAAEVLGLAQPKVSALLKGNVEAFSSARLIRCLNALSRDVEIVVKAKSPTRESGQVQVSDTRRPSSHATLVDARDLIAWSDRQDSRTELPRLIRQLASASPGVTKASFRTAEGTDSPGWDGLTVADPDNRRLPGGVTGWELSVRRDVQVKANEDYESRSQHSDGIDPKTTNFAFVTTRRWPNKTQWAQSKFKEGIWRSVTVLDADDLEAWLELSPSVHVWFSRILGKQPEGVIAINDWWADWSEATRPVLTQPFILAGRGEAVKLLEAAISNGTQTISVKAESKDEAIAFISAVILQNQKETWSSRALVVQASGPFERVASAETPLLLIPTFENVELLSRATRGNHQTIVPVGREQTASNAIEVPRLNVDKATAALKSPDLDEAAARDKATIARRSLMAFRRSISIRPELQTPTWASPSNAHEVLPFVLAGSWNESNPNDLAVIGSMGQIEPSRIPPLALRFARRDDPPFRSSGRTWYLTSQEDSWTLMAPALTQGDLERFRDAAATVLGTLDPRTDMPSDKRWYSSARPLHSAELRDGIAKTLAIMGARGSVTEVASIRVDRWAEMIVRDLLDKANGDWRLWHSIAKLLPTLAEAAPSAFLTAVEQGLEGTAPVLKLFDEQGDPLFHSSAHPHLLWALEKLSWSPDYLGRASAVLAKLTAMEPGGKIANRPRASLRDTFLLWHTQTAATWSEQLTVLKSLLHRSPDVGWQLHVDLLPKAHDTSSSRSKPEWRDWAPEVEPRITVGEHVRRIGDLVNQILTAVGSSGERWQSLIAALPNLPRESHDAVITRLKELSPGDLTEQSRSDIWNALREVIGQHRSFPTATWALPEENLSVLDSVRSDFEPTDATLRWGWLFADHVHLPAGRSADWQKEQEFVEAARSEAIEAILTTGGLAALEQMAGRVKRSDYLGQTLGRSSFGDSEGSQLVQQHLLSTDGGLHNLARGFLIGRRETLGSDWLVARSEASNLTVSQRAEVLSLLGDERRAWDLASQSEELNAEYWKRAYPFFRGEPKDVEYGARQLTKYERAYAAAELLAFRLKDPTPPPAALIADTLEALLRQPVPDPVAGGIGYWLGELLDAIAFSPDVPEERVAGIEWQLAPALSHDRPPKVLHRELRRRPEFFVDLLSLIYRADNEEPGQRAAKEDENRATAAYHVLDSWKSIPGPDDGSADSALLTEWVTKALSAGEAAHRSTITAQHVGKVLSHSPNGTDGLWPHESVRDVIEQLANREVERGLEIGVFNNRGVVTRSITGGGQQEHEIADRYAAHASQMKSRWPRTAEVLRQLEATYRDEARREDIESDRREDGLW